MDVIGKTPLSNILLSPKFRDRPAARNIGAESELEESEGNNMH
jgi:hypothetical protein